MLWRAVCDDRSRPVPRQALPRAVDALGLGALSTWPTVAIHPARPRCRAVLPSCLTWPHSVADG